MISPGFRLLLLLFLSLALPRTAAAEDVLRRYRLTDGVPKRLDYTELVLEEAMKRTRARYGAYRIETTYGRMGREEQLAAMVRGDEMNVAVVASQPSWELQLLPIYIPPDMGLSNYRIALTTAQGQQRLAGVSSLDALRSVRVGAGSAWSSRRVMEIAGFAVHSADNFDRLLDMLLVGQIDYFPRGLNEVFVEFDERSAANPALLIEQGMLLEFPLPGYVFVSPAHPRLHQRLSEGLESMLRDGSLLRLLKRYHAAMFRRADLCSRRVYRIDNPNLFNPKPLQRKELWFDAFSPRSGLCKPPRRLS